MPVQHLYIPNVINSPLGSNESVFSLYSMWILSWVCTVLVRMEIHIENSTEHKSPVLCYCTRWILTKSIVHLSLTWMCKHIPEIDRWWPFLKAAILRAVCKKGQTVREKWFWCLLWWSIAPNDQQSNIIKQSTGPNTFYWKPSRTFPAHHSLINNSALWRYSQNTVRNSEDFESMSKNVKLLKTW